MPKLVLEEWMSLDGYIADKNDGLDFFTHLTPEQNTYSDNDQLKFPETVDNILLGRKTYELFVAFWPDANIINGNIIEAIKKLKAQSGKNIVLQGSISLAQTLMREALIDEYHIQLCPVRLGSGRRLFPEELPGADLELAEVRKYDTGTVFLNYRLI